VDCLSVEIAPLPVLVLKLSSKASVIAAQKLTRTVPRRVSLAQSWQLEENKTFVLIAYLPG
jgi:hypothetical protein